MFLENSTQVFEDVNEWLDSESFAFSHTSALQKEQEALKLSRDLGHPEPELYSDASPELYNNPIEELAVKKVIPRQEALDRLMAHINKAQLEKDAAYHGLKDRHPNAPFDPAFKDARDKVSKLWDMWNIYRDKLSIIVDGNKAVWYYILKNPLDIYYDANSDDSQKTKGDDIRDRFLCYLDTHMKEERRFLETEAQRKSEENFTAYRKVQRAQRKQYLPQSISDQPDYISSDDLNVESFLASLEIA